LNIDVENKKDMQKLISLKAGTQVYLSGKILTGRDAAHKRIREIIESGKDLPIDLKDKLIYYMGPTPSRAGNVIGSCGPTSSYRMDSFLEMTLKLGIKGTIGKGDRGDFVKEIIKKYEAPYLITIGGAGAYLAKCILSKKTLAFEDLGAESINELTIKDFPAIIGIDCRGNQAFK